MIAGVVNQDLEATIRLILRTGDSRNVEAEAVIDTGFTGFLTLPSALVTDLNLAWLGRENAVLGDGTTHLFDVHSATVPWDGQPRDVEVDVTDTVPLVGMAMLLGHALHIEAIEGGKVTIDILP